MNLYNENMTTLVQSFKDSFTKVEAGVSTAGVTVGSRITKLTKPAKILSWSKYMTLETYVKQLQTWTEINDKVSEFVKFHHFIESLKINKDIKDLP